MRLLADAPPGARLTLLLFFIVALLEGMDLQAMGIAAPAMAKAFGFQPGQMRLVFSACILGLLPGAFLGGWCAGRFGRKRVLIACGALFGIFSIATAHVWNLESLLVARLLTGIGLGGALPNLIALSAESVDERARATAVSEMYCGVPLGGAVAAVVGLFDLGLGWRTVFYVGGIAPAGGAAAGALPGRDGGVPGPWRAAGGACGQRLAARGAPDEYGAALARLLLHPRGDYMLLNWRPRCWWGRASAGHRR